MTMAYLYRRPLGMENSLACVPTVIGVHGVLIQDKRCGKLLILKLILGAISQSIQVLRPTAITTEQAIPVITIALTLPQAQTCGTISLETQLKQLWVTILSGEPPLYLVTAKSSCQRVLSTPLPRQWKEELTSSALTPPLEK